MWLERLGNGAGSRRKVGRREREGDRPYFAVPKTQWDSNPTASTAIRL